MSIMVEVPPAMAEQTKEYEKAMGISLEKMLGDYLLERIRRRRKAEAAMQEWDRLVEQSTGRMEKPYVFNRADAYEPEIPYA